MVKNYLKHKILDSQKGFISDRTLIYRDFLLASAITLEIMKVYINKSSLSNADERKFARLKY